MLSKSDIDHAKKIDRYYKLYKAKFRDAGLKYLYNEHLVNSDVIEVVENLPQKITRTYASMMFLEKYTLYTDNKNGDAIRDILNANNFQKKLLQSAHSQSYAGYAVFEVSKVNDEVIISLIKPDYVFIASNQLSPDLPYKSIRIGWYFTHNDRRYMFMKEHTTDTIKSAVYECDAMGIPTDNKFSPDQFGYDVPEEESQFEQGIPVFIVQNDIHEIGHIYGTSDYESNESLLQEHARNMSQIGNELHHFGNAILAVPGGVLDKNGRPKVAGAKMIQIDTNDSEKPFVPQYITNNNPQIDKAQTHMENVLRAICRSTDMAEILVGLNTQGGAEKVGALRLRLLLTLARVKAKLHSYHLVLPKLVAFAAQIGGLQVDADEIEFEFYDGLPEDMVEKVDIQVKRYNAGLQSLSDALIELDNLTDEQLQQKIVDIREEEKAETALFPQSV